MSNLNEQQRKIAENTEGFIVVDAGPGTGKTKTITERYLNLVKGNVNPSDILMVTFTVNAAEEMRGRIREKLVEAGTEMNRNEKYSGDFLLRACNEIRTSTFDAYCLHAVLGSPDIVSDFFGFRETLSRGAVLVENETLNKEYFRSFYAGFTRDYGDLYRDKGDYPAVMADHVDDLYYLLGKLMSLGIIPLDDDEWFSDGWDRLVGDEEGALNHLTEVNGPKLAQLDSNSSGGRRWEQGDHMRELFTEGTAPKDTKLSQELLAKVAKEERKHLLYFIRHVYFEYIRQSVRDNRLTFSLVKILAFAVLYSDENVRRQNSVDYLIVDEFQDTDELQMMICLMLLRKPNFCAVGDWKQGIYGFRNASVDNILRFEEKVNDIADWLGNRVPFGSDIPRIDKESLDINYRSTQKILEPAFRAMFAPGSESDVVKTDPKDVTELTPDKGNNPERHPDLYNKYTDCEYWYSDDKESEYEDIVDKITEYVYSGKYQIVDGDKGTVRPARFGDIGVLFRKTKDCIALYEAAAARGIPAFLQGELEIMSSLPGKLALAWLRFINDSRDRRGVATILVKAGYPINRVRYIIKGEEGDGKTILDRMPAYLVDERKFLMRKRRRPNDLLTSIFAFYGLDEDPEYADIAQAIVRMVSSSYDGSLITIPDIIRLFEEDIRQSTRYDIDAILGTDAVTIQTMHKSKGLEYPIVIVGGVSSGRMPSREKDRGILSYDPLFGLRCSKVALRSGDTTEGIADSWRAKVISNSRVTDYDEERRLLFVSMTRAEQYMFIASGPSVSPFYGYVSGRGDEYRGERPDRHPVKDTDRTDHVTEDPVIDPYTRRRRNIAVHDLMEYKEGAEDSGKGKEYGIRVHAAAQQLALGKEADDSLPETAKISRILKGMGGAVFKTEYDCALPVGEVTVRGVIDLFADFGDRIEIHDWKTDIDRRNLESYVVQLSVYAHVAKQVRDVPVRCFVDFVSQEGDTGVTVEINPLSMEEISERVERYLTQPFDVDE